MSTADDSLIGQVLDGRYAITAEVGRGGHGVVYRATHVQLERVVAVKLITTPGDGLDRRFRREAQVQARLRHPAVVKLLDFGVDGSGRLYMVQEFVEGESLQERLARGTPPIDEAALVIGDVLDALAEAHALGIVHRDVKPSNIMVVDGPRRIEARLLDFGIAKLLDHAGHTRLTRAGSLVGTPGYMAPEQVALEPLSPASDLYSAGVVLYQLLCGQRPYNGTVKEVLSAHLHGSPPPLPAFVPPAMARVARVALARDPAERFADADAMHAALRAAHRAADAGAGYGPSLGAELATPPLDRRSLSGFPAGRASLAGAGTPPGDVPRGRPSLSTSRRHSGPQRPIPSSIEARRSLSGAHGTPSGSLPPMSVTPGPRTRIDDGVDVAHLTPRLDDSARPPTGSGAVGTPPGFGPPSMAAAPQDRPTAPRFQPTPSAPARRAPPRLGLIAALAVALAVATAGLTLWIARPGAARDEGPIQRVKVGANTAPRPRAVSRPIVAPPTPRPTPAMTPISDAALDPEPAFDPEPALDPDVGADPAPARRPPPRRRRTPRVAHPEPAPPPPDASAPAPAVEPVAALEAMIDAAFDACRCDDALARLDSLARLDPASARQRRSRHRQECRLALPGNCVTRAAGEPD